MEEPIACRNKYLYRLLPMRLLGVSLPLSDQLSLPKSGLSLDLGLLCGRPLLQKSPPSLQISPTPLFFLLFLFPLFSFFLFSFLLSFPQSSSASHPLLPATHPICRPGAAHSRAVRENNEKIMIISRKTQLLGWGVYTYISVKSSYRYIHDYRYFHH